MFFENNLVEAMVVPWKDSLVVKILGLFMGFTAMREKLRNIWKLSANFDIMDVGNGYFMVKFDNQVDREKVIKEGPWMINDHYLAVKKGSPDFNPQDACFGRTMVWVRFPCLNLMYYDEQIIKRVAWGIGKPVKVDMTTQSVARGRYTRVCVEIDLHKPIATEIWLNDHWNVLEYESLHLICASCGCYRHVARHYDRIREDQ